MNTCVYVLLARYLWVQCQCEPRAIELVRIAEAMPDFAACFLQDAKLLQYFGSCKKNRLRWNPNNISHRKRVLTSHRSHRSHRKPCGMIILTQRRRERGGHTENFIISHRIRVLTSHRSHRSHRNDERVRTELYLYKLCQARRRKARPNYILW